MILMILTKTVIFTACVAFYALKLYGDDKQKFDEKKLPYSFKNDFWKWHNDEVILFALGAFIGLIGGTGLTKMILNNFVNIDSEVMYISENAVSILACFFTGKYLEKIIHAK